MQGGSIERWQRGSDLRYGRDDGTARGSRLGMKTVGNGRKTSQPFSTSTFEYENKNKSGKAEHENEHELTEYKKFRKQTNSSGITLNTVGIRKINTEY